MRDRFVEHPNRYRMIHPIPGDPDVVDLIPEPGEVWDEGSPWNKAFWLSDSTAAMLGFAKSDDPSVDQALAALAPLHSGLGNQHLWAQGVSQIDIVPGEADPSTTVLQFNKGTATLQYSDKAEYVDGEIKLVNPQTLSFTYINYQTKPSGDANIGILKGKYFSTDNGRYVRYIPPDATISSAMAQEYNTYYYFVYASQIFFPIPKYRFDITAYMNGPKDAKFSVESLIPLGPLGQKVFLGSYIGTGESPSKENPKKLTFDFSPSVVVVSSEECAPLILVRGATQVGSDELFGNQYPKVYVTWETTSVSWYADVDTGRKGMNKKDALYSFAAF